MREYFGACHAFRTGFMNERSPSAGMHADVSILLGAGRSGTTLLYKILAMHRKVAYVNNYVQKLPSWPSLSVLNRLLHNRPGLKRRAWFLDEGGAYLSSKRIRSQALVPTPFEGEAVFQRCGVPLTPVTGALPDPRATARLREAFTIMRRGAGGDTIMMKRTANNRRVPWLEAAFPGARYIHLVRDGRAVAYSLLRVNWWAEHTLYWAGKTPRQMVVGGADELELAARNWVEEMASIESGLKQLGPDRVLQMRYEDLLANPRAEVQRALEFIGVSFAADPAFGALLEGLKLQPRQEPWSSRWTPQETERVLRLQGETLARWGYVG